MPNAPEMDIFTATMIAEGVEDATPREKLNAWAALIRSGACWSLQGWFGRNANDLINRGIITAAGEITERALDLLSEDDG